MAYRRHQRRIGGHRPAHGALVRGTFSSEFYVAVRALPGLQAGLWHYRPQGHGLARIGPQAAPDAALLPAEALAAVIATAVWRRTGHKHGDRCLRYVLADLGHALENLCQVAAALGAGTTLSGAFDESALARLLQVDEREEGVLAQVLLHAGPVQLRQLPPALLLRRSRTTWESASPGPCTSPPHCAGRRSGRPTSLRRRKSRAIRCR